MITRGILSWKRNHLGDNRVLVLESSFADTFLSLTSLAVFILTNRIPLSDLISVYDFISGFHLTMNIKRTSGHQRHICSLLNIFS